MEEGSIQSLGGKARAEALTSEERTKIARDAAQTRWGTPEATHKGELEIAGLVIPCFVLEDGTRVLSQGGFLRAIGRSRTPKAGTGASVAKTPTFLAADNLKPFVNNDLVVSTSPVRFRVTGNRFFFGYRAEILPQICEVYLKLRDEGEPTKVQRGIIQRCDILMRGLAHVGIIALVDEATGYQEVRDRLALQRILELYISKELLKWARRFPPDFYREMFRLKGWKWEGMQVKKPQVIGHYTNEFVYERLAPGVLEELRHKNPPDDRGHRRHRHHQWLTPDVGHPRLRDHLSGVIALMKASKTWPEFIRMLNKAFPKPTGSLELGLDD